MLAVFVAALCLAGGAFSYFKTTGSGSASANVGTTQAVTITAGVTPTTPLFPGTTGDVTVHITNPNTIDVHIGKLVLDMSSPHTTGFSGPSLCDPPPLTFTTQTGPGGNGWTVPKHIASDGVLDLDLTGSISLATTAANACQGGTFTVYLQATP